MWPFGGRFFPGTNLQDLNLDWIVQRVRDLSKGIIAPWINPDTKTWMVFNTESETFEDSGVSAQGTSGLPVLGRIPAGTVSIIGDSISSFDGEFEIPGYRTYYPRGNVEDITDMWWHSAVYSAGASMLVNASYSGSRVTNTDPNRPDFYARTGAAVIGNPDTIIIALGSNDSRENIALGDYDYSTEYTQLSEATFRTAYIKGVKALQALHPNSKIIALMFDMADDYKQSIASICATLGVTCVDAGTYTKVSTIHPDKFGHATVASAFETGCDLSSAPLVLNSTDATLLVNNILPTGETDPWNSGAVKIAKWGKIVLVSLEGIVPRAELTSWTSLVEGLPDELLAPYQGLIAIAEMATSEPALTKKLRVRCDHGRLQVARGAASATYTGVYLYMCK